LTLNFDYKKVDPINWVGLKRALKDEQNKKKANTV